MAGTTAPKADTTSRATSATKTEAKPKAGVAGKPKAKPKAGVAGKPKAKPKAGVAGKPEAKKKSMMYVSKNITMYNPIAMVRFHPGSPIKCNMDDWLKAQIKVGLIKEA